MTIAEMHTEVELLLQKIGTYAIDNFLREEVDVYLNREQIALVRDKFQAVGNPQQRGFEQMVRRLDELRLLHQVQTILATPLEKAAYLATEYVAELPENYLHYIAARAKSRHNPCGQISDDSPTTVGKVRLVETQALDDMMRNPFAKTKADAPLAVISTTMLRIQSDASFAPYEVEMEFLRYPIKMAYPDINCELPEFTHTEIVNRAVRAMLENIESPRYQSHSIQTAMDE